MTARKPPTFAALVMRYRKRILIVAAFLFGMFGDEYTTNGKTPGEWRAGRLCTKIAVALGATGVLTKRHDQ